MTQRTGVRIAIAGIFAFLGLFTWVADARSQPRPGGIGGVPRPPSFPRPPSIPQPPSFNPPSFPQPPSFPRGPQFETVWSCGKCNAELGRGTTKPSFDSCPRCGVRFVNGGGGGGGGFGLVSPPPPAMPSMPTTPPVTNTPADPDLLPRGNPAVGGFDPPSLSPSSNNDTNSKPDSEGKTSKMGSVVLKIMIAVFALLFVAGMAGGAFLIYQANKGSKPAKRSRRRVIDDEDEDD